MQANRWDTSLLTSGLQARSRGRDRRKPQFRGEKQSNLLQATEKGRPSSLRPFLLQALLFCTSQLQEHAGQLLVQPSLCSTLCMWLCAKRCCSCSQLSKSCTKHTGFESASGNGQVKNNPIAVPRLPNPYPGSYTALASSGSHKWPEEAAQNELSVCKSNTAMQRIAEFLCEILLQTKLPPSLFTESSTTNSGLSYCFNSCPEM